MKTAFFKSMRGPAFSKSVFQVKAAFREAVFRFTRQFFTYFLAKSCCCCLQQQPQTLPMSATLLHVCYVAPNPADYPDINPTHSYITCLHTLPNCFITRKYNRFWLMGVLIDSADFPDINSTHSHITRLDTLPNCFITRNYNRFWLMVP